MPALVRTLNYNGLRAVLPKKARYDKMANKPL